MAKKKQNQLDFDYLRAAILKAISEMSNDPSEDGLVKYLIQQAKEKPSAFFSLLLKIAQADNQEQKNNSYPKSVKIKIVPAALPDLTEDAAES